MTLVAVPDLPDPNRAAHLDTARQHWPVNERIADVEQRLSALESRLVSYNTPDGDDDMPPPNVDDPESAA